MLQFRVSRNDYDWLGHGIYFWEATPKRALEFAKEMKQWRLPEDQPIKNPFAVGAAIDLGNYLDLMSMTGIEEVRSAFSELKQLSNQGLFQLAENSGGDDLLFRRLDCQVINLLHALREEKNNGRFDPREIGSLPPYDTVRGLFVEGKPIYEQAGFHEKTHVQICVININCIKGVMRIPANHFQQ